MPQVEFVGGGPWDGQVRSIGEDCTAIVMCGKEAIFLRRSDPVIHAPGFPDTYHGHYSRHGRHFHWTVWNMSRLKP